MKPAVLLAAAALLVAGPALAQNAGQIASVRGGASCAGCNLFQADLGNLTLKNKNLSRARLRQAEMSAAILNGTNFSGADLRDVNAYGALFTGANFSGAEMDRASGLTQSQLNRACGDESTRLPNGMRIPNC